MLRVIAVGLSVALAGPACVRSSSALRQEEGAGIVSYQEALWECSRIALPVPSLRAVDFQPLVACVSAVEREHRPGPAAKFGVFVQEIQLRYRRVRDDLWSPALAEEVDVATRAVLRAYWERPGGDRMLSEREKTLWQKHYPQTAWELRIEGWPARRGFRVDPSLERLRAGLAALEAHGVSDAGVCEQLRALRAEATQLGALFQDLGDLSEIAPPQGSALGIRQWERYRERVQQSTDQLNSLQGIVRAVPVAPEASDTNVIRERLVGACPPRAPDA